MKDENGYDIGFGDNVHVDGSEDQSIVIGISQTEVTVIDKIEVGGGMFSYSIRRVLHNKVILS